MACRIRVRGVPRFSRYGEHNRLGLTLAGLLVGQINGSLRLALANGGGEAQSSLSGTTLSGTTLKWAVEFAE